MEDARRRGARYFPERQRFAEIAAGNPGCRVPVYRQILGDRLTPVTAYDLLTDDDSAEHAFLLESVVGGENVGRYSFLGANPTAVYEARRDRATLRLGEGEPRSFTTDDPLSDLRRLLASAGYVRNPKLPGFTGGLVGFAGYDLVRYYEPAKLGGPDGGPRDDRGIPDVLFALFDACVVFDHVDKTIKAIAHAISPESPDEARIEQAYDAACGQVDALVARLCNTPAVEPGEIDPAAPGEPDHESNLTRQQYEKAVERGLDHIRAGDIFQFVPSLRLRMSSSARPFDVYRALRVINPSPFMVYLRSPGCTLIGNSPEILCRVRDGVVTTRPLAGTRQRGATPEEDEALAAELLADAKERSEHVMLVDLHRNDVGRVAETGSVRVDDLMTVERYSHVMHITTNVTGRLAEGFDALDALRVSLPVGTVSGAPKVRAMQIIDEVEPTRRGPYGGAVGHLDFSGEMDTCIALRTIVWQAAEPTGAAGRRQGVAGVYDVQAGAGVVADSDPGREYEECMAKARAMLRAVRLAEEGF